MKLKTGFLMGSSLNTALEFRYHSETKLARPSSQLKAILIVKYQDTNHSDAKSFEQMITDVERLSSVAHEEDQSHH